MGPKARRLLDETLRFMAVGGVATFVAFVIFNFLVHGVYLTEDPWMHSHPTLAYVVANTVGMVISYRGTKSWAFKNRETAHADGGRTAYVAINLATMALPIACLWISRNLLDQDSAFADNIAANVVGLGFGMVARFYLFRQVIFSQKNYAPAALAGTTTMPIPGNSVVARGSNRDESGPPESDPGHS
ncbi:putative flippase GtrA [Nocardioides daedukensis]|uniref:Putative flippase GtrA n=1 Tax=Nocardioides daedukensis TaxID=634462 RepID=A0A7Y9URW8_9ACTN|nr:GtrA family protein [Nocardioides daedukensis]NYG60296.1 putative flippase GtrA [Nocardioides daedukensis]